MLASVGSVGDAYDNALAESFVDSLKTELIIDRIWRRRSPLELVIVEYLGWFNNARLHASLAEGSPDGQGRNEVELKFRVTRKRLVLLVVAAALVTAGGIGYAAIPDSNGVYTACRLNGVGTIRLIDPAATPASSLLNHCTSLENEDQLERGRPEGPDR